MSQVGRRSEAGRSDGRAGRRQRLLLVAGVLGIAVAATASGIGAAWVETSQDTDPKSERMQELIRKAREAGHGPGKMKSEEKDSNREIIRFVLSDVDEPQNPQDGFASVPNGKDANGMVRYLTVPTEDSQRGDRKLVATFKRLELREAVNKSKEAGISGSGKRAFNEEELEKLRDKKLPFGSGMLTTTVIVTDQKQPDRVVDETTSTFIDPYVGP